MFANNRLSEDGLSACSVCLRGLCLQPCKGAHIIISIFRSFVFVNSQPPLLEIIRCNRGSLRCQYHVSRWIITVVSMQPKAAQHNSYNPCSSMQLKQINATDKSCQNVLNILPFPDNRSSSSSPRSELDFNLKVARNVD